MKTKNLFICTLISFMILFFVMPNFSPKKVKAEDNLTILFSATFDEENGSNLDVTANLVQNSGINACTFELVYDRDVFEFIGFEKGEALSKLDLKTTNTNTSLGYSISPFKFNWWNQDIENDSSTGVLVKIHFRIKDSVENGNYTISFSYNEGDVTYNGTMVKRPSINGIKIEVNNSKVERVENEMPTDNTKTAIIVASAVGSTIVIVPSAIYIPKLIKRKRKKWVKIQ